MKRRTDLKEWMIATFLLAMSHTGATESTEFQEWRSVTYIRDGVSSSELKYSTSVGSLVLCVFRCSQENDCAMAGFSASRGVCDLYGDIVTIASTLTFQDSTIFYRRPTTCTQQNYTYVEQLNVCLRVSTVMEKFLDARASCQLEGGDLIMMKTEELRNYLGSSLDFENRYWIGATQIPGNESSWLWLDNDSVTHDMWSPGEPNNEHERCAEVIFSVQGKLVANDNWCGAAIHYICQIV